MIGIPTTRLIVWIRWAKARRYVDAFIWQRRSEVVGRQLDQMRGRMA